MTLIRWTDPFRDISSIQDRMNQLFGEIERGRGGEEELGTGIWMPAVDIYETQDAVFLRAELPGIDKDSVSVEVKDGVLRLQGERKFEKEADGENYHRVERAYGRFHRSFALPPTVDGDKVTARMKDGILEVKLPKKEQAKPKQIRIST